MTAARPVILVVDDAAVNREALVDVLAEEGFQAVGAADAEAARAQLAHGGVDLVLLDVGLPRVSGLVLLDEVRRTRSRVELPVVMVTAHVEANEIVDALARGANDYVTKPIDVDVLLARVRTHLEVQRLSRLKDEFLHVASHDLKNPLTAILGAADALHADFPTGEPMTELGRWYVDTVIRRARQMTRIVGDFLDLGAIVDGRLVLTRAPVDVGALVARAVEDNLGWARKKGITLTHAAAMQQLPSVDADPARVAQVLDNLVGNAIKYLPPGGHVEVATAAVDGEAVRIEVRDDGPGLTPADLERLFTKGARGSSRPTGGESSTGIGLSICKDLVEAHGGRIGAHLNRADGRGAVFWFELPQRRQ